MRRIIVNKSKLVLNDNDVIGFLEKKVTPYGTGAKIDCIKQFIGHSAYVIITKRK